MNRSKSSLTYEDREVLRGLFEVVRADLVDGLTASNAPEPAEIRSEIADYDRMLAAVDDGSLEPTEDVRPIVGELGGSVDGLLGRLEGRRPSFAGRGVA